MKKDELKENGELLNNNAYSTKDGDDHEDKGNPLEDGEEPKYLVHGVSII